MAPKKCEVSKQKRGHKSLTLKEKHDIVKLAEQGLSKAEIGRMLDMPRTSVSGIIRDKYRILDQIKSAVPVHTKIIKKKNTLISEMEKVLQLWIKDHLRNRIPLSRPLIQAKALTLFNTLKARGGEEVTSDTFIASRGWFEKFKSRANLHSIKVTGEDGKLDMFSMVGANLTDNSMGEMPGTSIEDQPVPLSQEQHLTEEVDHPNTPHSIPIPQRPESYKLRNNNHLSLVLESMAGDESFMDVTLTAQGKAIKAHKSVLSAVSSYFKSVLKSNPCQHPIIIMPRDIRFEELNSIVSYVYKGEMTVAAEDLPSLLRTAEILQVTGLTPSDSSAMGTTSSSILGHIASRGAKSAASAVNQDIRSSATESSQKRSHKFHSTSVQKEAQKNSPYDNDLSDKVDPFDFLNTDITYVKEEIESDTEFIADTVNESETSVDNNFHSSVVQNDNKSNDSHTIQKSCPLSKKRKTSVDANSLQADKGETENNPDSLPDDSLSDQTALFVCPYCFQSHCPTEVLQAHIRLKHPSKPSFICKCGKVTIRQSLYDQHVKTCDSS